MPELLNLASTQQPACPPMFLTGQKKDRKQKKTERKQRMAARKAEKTGLPKQVNGRWGEWVLEACGPVSCITQTLGWQLIKL